MYQFDRKEYEKRMEWYQDARFWNVYPLGIIFYPCKRRVGMKRRGNT